MIIQQYIIIGLLLMTSSLLYGQPKDSNILSEVDIPPLFEGCDDPLISEEQRQACSVPKIQAFVNHNIIYPDSAKAKSIEGVVVVRFSVTEEGKITALELVRDIGGGCGEEAMRVVRMMPQFRPALRDGQPIATKMTLPIRFKKLDEAQADNKNLYQIHWGNVYENGVTKAELAALLKRYLLVRDYYGNTYDIKYFELKVITPNKEFVAETTGNILSKEMHKLLKKVKPFQQIHLTATINKDYKDIAIERTFYVVK